MRVYGVVLFFCANELGVVCIKIRYIIYLDGIEYSLYTRNQWDKTL